MEFPRIKRLPPYVFNAIGELCLKARRAGEDIIDFGMGNPDEPTPPHIVNKLIEATAKGSNHRYSVSRGVYKLRLAICDWYKRRYGVEFDPDSEAIVTIGSKEGIGHLVLTGEVDYPLHKPVVNGCSGGIMGKIDDQQLGMRARATHCREHFVEKLVFIL